MISTTNNDKVIQKDYLLKDIVQSEFKTAQVFERYNIDFCCNGKRTLKEAVNEKGLDENKIISELNDVLQESETENDYKSWNLKKLTQFIVDTHHTYVRNALPTIIGHLEKVTSKHGSKYLFLNEVLNIFSQVNDEMISHMHKEEKILFPIVKYLADSEKFNEKPRTAGFGTIKNPIRQMEAEHDNAGNAMHQIRELTNNYTLPEDACTTFAITYKELDDFEKDLHKHVHLENNILFPRAIELEEKLLEHK
jgi:regulator of cell morphogenesis and NO signaling